MVLVWLFLLLGWSCAMDLDPEANMTAPEIISYWGYPCESVQVYTDDGYMLTMHRIPYGKGQTPSKSRPVLFLQHGLFGASSNFITSLPWLSLGFMAADAGFDVWLGNVRGNEYSIGHKTLDPQTREYWAFTWDEMVKYDLPTMINTALNSTGQDHLYYAGHSQGTLIMFSHLAAYPDFQKKIRQFHALAPVGTVQHIQGVVSFLAHNFEPELEILSNLFGYNDFFPDDKLVKFLKKLFCEESKAEEQFCTNLVFLYCGPDSNQLNATRLPVFLSDMPGGTSTQNVVHWCQMVHSGLQQMYDFGSHEKNQEHYGQDTPPIYDVSKITVPMYFYRSDTDWLATKQDIEDHLLKKIDKKYIYLDSDLKEYNHLDFIWGQRAPEEIYIPLIQSALNDHAELEKA